MAKLSKEELDQIKKLEQKINKIQNKFASLKIKQENRLRKIKDSYFSKIKEIDEKIKNAERYRVKGNPKANANLDAFIAKLNQSKREASIAFEELEGKVKAGFFRATKNLARMQQDSLNKIKNIKNPDLLKKAYKAFQKIPYKKTAAGVTVGAGALVAATALKRYSNLEKQRAARLKKAK